MVVIKDKTVVKSTWWSESEYYRLLCSVLTSIHGSLFKLDFLDGILWLAGTWSWFRSECPLHKHLHKNLTGWLHTSNLTAVLLQWLSLLLIWINVAPTSDHHQNSVSVKRRAVEEQKEVLLPRGKSHQNRKRNWSARSESLSQQQHSFYSGMERLDLSGQRCYCFIDSWHYCNTVTIHKPDCNSQLIQWQYTDSQDVPYHIICDNGSMNLNVIWSCHITILRCVDVFSSRLFTAATHSN